MQIEIYAPTQGQPLPPIEWNYPELKKWVEDGLAAYKGRIYTDDNIAIAKQDRANLNKLADAIDTKRKEMKAVYLEPYTEFERQAKELTALVKAQADEIAAQIKAYDDFRKSEKQAKITELYFEKIGDLAALVPYDRLHNPKWLNVTTSMTSIDDELTVRIGSIKAGLATIDKVGIDSEIVGQIKSLFLSNGYNLAAALAEVERIEAERAEMERIKAAAAAPKPVSAEKPDAPKDTPAEPENGGMTRYSDGNTAEPIHTVTFRIRVTASKLALLGDFMRANGIVPERV